MITSLRNPRVAAARKLRRSRVRKETGRTIIEGPLVLGEALRADALVHEVFCRADDSPTREICADRGIEVALVAPHVIDGLAETAQPRGPVAVVDIKASGAVQTVDSIVLWRVGDPGNAGTIIRTAVAFEFQVIATVDSVDLWSPKVLRAAAGAHFRAKLIEAVPADPDELVSADLRLVVTAADGPASLREAVAGDEPVAFSVGNEAHGVPASLRQHPATTTAAIPMPGGTDSLNAAVAAAVVMYERMQARPR